jgi:hypothetical protein
MLLDACSCWLPCEMGETWAGGGAARDGDEAGIRRLGLVESLGDSVSPDARRFTALSSCDSSRTSEILVLER